jgi:two-component system LytT family response regulator
MALTPIHPKPLARPPPMNKRQLDGAGCLPVKCHRRVVLLKYDDIDWIGAAHNYVNVQAGKQSHLLRGTLQSIELRLPAGRFVRLSHSMIVQIARIKELERLLWGNWRVELHDGTSLTLSRRYRANFQEMGWL